MDIMHKGQVVNDDPFQGMLASSDLAWPGKGVCFDSDYGTATSIEGERNHRVEDPSSSNNRSFAGVITSRLLTTAMTYDLGVEIQRPGCVAEISPIIDTVINATILTCIAGPAGIAGFWGPAGFRGRGTAIALQTATISKASSTDGSATTSGTTLTKTAAFGSSAAGDKVLIVGGTGAAVTAGVYTISSVSSANAVVLTAAPGDGNVTFYSFTPNADGSYPTVLALLDDGPESGLTEYVSPSSGVAAQSMVGGVTFLCGGYTIAADSTATLADGTAYGEKKSFKLLGDLTTKDWILTVTTGLQKDKAATLASLAFDAASTKGYAHLEWAGNTWINIVGNATEA